jgi:hypothetical protein
MPHAPCPMAAASSGSRRGRQGTRRKSRCPMAPLAAAVVVAMVVAGMAVVVAARHRWKSVPTLCRS